MGDTPNLQAANGVIPRIEIDGKFFRDVDRIMGRLPKLDQALQKKMPGVRQEFGSLISGKAKFYAPKLSGALAAAIGYETKGDSLVVGVWGIPYAYPTELGFTTRMIVKEHDRMQTNFFGEKVTPFKVVVGTFVRKTKAKRQQFLYPAYYASFRPMFGILNRVIEECKKEVDLGD